jgi:hypothetical protein
MVQYRMVQYRMGALPRVRYEWKRGSERVLFG